MTRLLNCRLEFLSLFSFLLFKSNANIWMTIQLTAVVIFTSEYANLNTGIIG
jgi:hypothetical protein